MIIDGRAIAQDILKDVREQVGEDQALVMRAIAVSPTPATQSYLRAKTRAAETAGMRFEVVSLPADADTARVISAVTASGADTVIVQLPLSEGIDTQAVLEAIPLAKDADALSPAARAAGAPVPPVAAAVEEILVRSGIVPAGKKAVVIGKGFLVGTPVAERLAALGATTDSYDIDTFTPAVLADADIIVSGAGVPRLVQPDHIKEGVVLIDAGTSEDGGALVGDIDPACADKAAVYTPVPGGVGPVAVACLMRNAAQIRAQLRTADIQVL